MSRAVFLDRDGVLNALVVNREHGVVDAPMTDRQLRVTAGAGRAVRLLNGLGLRVIVVSNQPGIAKGKQRPAMLDAVTARLVRAIRRQGGRIDDIRYCLHHPAARVRRLRRRCACRKPEPGLLREAAKAWGVRLRGSYMVGDGLVDMLAGRRAGCTTIWVGDLRCEFCRALGHRARPDHQVRDVWEAARLIKALEARA